MRFTVIGSVYTSGCVEVTVDDVTGDSRIDVINEPVAANQGVLTNGAPDDKDEQKFWLYMALWRLSERYALLLKTQIDVLYPDKYEFIREQKPVVKADA